MFEIGIAGGGDLLSSVRATAVNSAPLVRLTPGSQSYPTGHTWPFRQRDNISSLSNLEASHPIRYRSSSPALPTNYPFILGGSAI